MAKQLPGGFLSALAPHFYQEYFIQLSPGYTFEDLFQPVFWAHHKRLKRFDIIRVVAHDWSFDVKLTVTARPEGGAHVQLHPMVPNVSTLPSMQVVPMVRGKVAVRVEYTKANKWRVIALDQSEQSAGYETEAEATAAMYRYLRDLRMVLPTADAKPEVKPSAKDGAGTPAAKDKDTAAA
jgi:hypothetical protein